MRSFAGTLVLMADGSKKPISEIELGDEVVATDLETGERFTRRVTQLWVHDDELADLVLVDGRILTTTTDHLFWSVTDQKFEQADKLAAGEVVLGDGGRQFTVTGFRHGTVRNGLAYNLEIEGVHTYHVGPDAILVHNDCDPFDTARALRGADPEDVLDAIPDNWIVSNPPKAIGGGMKFSNPANRSQVMIYERGTGLASDGVHGGPYLRLSSGRGAIERIPLMGNPILAVP